MTNFPFSQKILMSKKDKRPSFSFSKENSHHEINILKGILYKDSYPRDFVDKCIKNFLDKVLTPKVVVSTVPKKDLMIVPPYLEI